MKTLIIIILFFSLVFFLSNAGNVIKITTDVNDMVIEVGDNSFVATIMSDYEEDLRIYGITVNDEDKGAWSPFGYAKYIFMASPLKGMKEGCEKNDAMRAPLYNMIVEDRSIDRKIDTLIDMTDGRRSATIIGKKVYIEESFYKEEDHSDSLKKQGKIDPRHAILIEKIIIL